LDDERLKQGKKFSKDYFDELLERIREIRASERRFYQKITDLYALTIQKIQELQKNCICLFGFGREQYRTGILMYMKDWSKFLGSFLQLSNTRY
jgi:hypothetical protein